MSDVGSAEERPGISEHCSESNNNETSLEQQSTDRDAFVTPAQEKEQSELSDGSETPQSVPSPFSGARPSSATSDSCVERRKRRFKTSQKLQCIRCHAFDFPNYCVFHNHHLLHAYESFLLVSVERLEEHTIKESHCDFEEQETENHTIVDDMTNEYDGQDGKREPIRLKIKLSSIKERKEEHFENHEMSFRNDYGNVMDEIADQNLQADQHVESSEAHVMADPHSELNISTGCQDTTNKSGLDDAKCEKQLNLGHSMTESLDDLLGDLEFSEMFSTTAAQEQSSDGSVETVSTEQASEPESVPQKVPGRDNDAFVPDDDIQPLTTTKCAPCSMCFFSAEDLQRHVEENHGVVQKCCRCGDSFRQFEDLIVHVREAHANDLHQQPDHTPVPLKPKSEPNDPKPAVQKLRVIPSSQLMSVSARSGTDPQSQQSDFVYQHHQPALQESQVSQGQQQMVIHNQNFGSMMQHINNVASGGFSQRLNGVLAPPPFPFDGGQGARPFIPVSHQSFMQQHGGPMFRPPPQQNHMVRIPRQQIPSGLVRPPNMRPGTRVPGRGRPLMSAPGTRGMRPQMNPHLRPQAPMGNTPRKRTSLPPPGNAPVTKQPRQDNDDIEVVAIKPRAPAPPPTTESTGLPRLPNSISVSIKTVTPAPEKPVEGGSILASVLAHRGITVTPAASDSHSPSANQTASSLAASLGTDVTVSPSVAQQTSRVSHSLSNPFAEPAPPGPRMINEKDRPPRPPTVDLTVDQVHNQKFYTCQACKKRFPDVQKLKIHLESHINPRMPQPAPSPGGAFICNVCNCPFHSQQALEAHRQLSHPPKLAKADSLAIPIVDLSDPAVTSRLSQLGIKTCLPVGRLASLGNGSYGIPLVSIDSRTGSSNFPLSSAILTLGTIQNLPQ